MTDTRRKRAEFALIVLLTILSGCGRDKEYSGADGHAVCLGYQAFQVLPVVGKYSTVRRVERWDYLCKKCEAP